MAEAGESSPHLDQKEQRQAAAGAPMGALVIHEIVRDQGEEELERSFGGLAWSGIAAGLSIGTLFTLFVVPAVYMLLATEHTEEGTAKTPHMVPAD